MLDFQHRKRSSLVCHRELLAMSDAEPAFISILLGSIHPYHHVSHLQHLAETHVSIGDHPRAMQLYEAAINRLRPNSPSSLQFDLYWKLALIIRTTERCNELEFLNKAIPLLRTALTFRSIEDGEIYARVITELGIALMQRDIGPDKKDCKEALEHFQLAILLNDNPRDINHLHRHINCGRCLLKLGRFEEAKDYFLRASRLSIAPNQPEALATAKLDLAMTLYHMESEDRNAASERVIVSLREILDIKECDISSTPDLWFRANFNLSVILSQRIIGDRKDNLEEAITYLKNAKLLMDADGKTSIGYSKICSHLGNLYEMRLQGNRVNNLISAIKYHEYAIVFSSSAENSMEKANILSNLLMAEVSHRAHSNRIDLETSIHMCRNAIPDETFVNSSLTSTRLFLAIGSAFYHISSKTSCAESLSKSITYFQRADNISVRTHDIMLWLRVQCKLAAALLDESGKLPEQKLAVIRKCIRSLSSFTNVANLQIWMQTLILTAKLKIRSVPSDKSILDLRSALIASRDFQALLNSRIMYSWEIENVYCTVPKLLTTMLLGNDDLERAFKLHDEFQVSIVMRKIHGARPIQEDYNEEQYGRFLNIRSSIQLLLFQMNEYFKNEEVAASALENENYRLLQEQYIYRMHELRNELNRHSTGTDILQDADNVSMDDMYSFLKKYNALMISFSCIPSVEDLGEGKWGSFSLHAFSIFQGKIKLHKCCDDFENYVRCSYEDTASEIINILGKFISSIFIDWNIKNRNLDNPKRLIIVPSQELKGFPISVTPISASITGSNEILLGDFFEGQVWINPSLSIAVRIDECRKICHKGMNKKSLLSAICPTLTCEKSYVDTVSEYGRNAMTHLYMSDCYPPRQKLFRHDGIPSCDILALVCNGVNPNTLIQGDNSFHHPLYPGNSGLFFKNPEELKQVEGMPIEGPSGKGELNDMSFEKDRVFGEGIVQLSDLWSLGKWRCGLAIVFACSEETWCGGLQGQQKNMNLGTAMLMAGARNVICAPKAVSQESAAAILFACLQQKSDFDQDENLLSLPARLWEAKVWLRDVDPISFFERLKFFPEERMVGADGSSSRMFSEWAAFDLVGPPF